MTTYLTNCLAILLVLFISACGSGSSPKLLEATQGEQVGDIPVVNQVVPTEDALRKSLVDQLEQLGIDPNHIVSSAPTVGSEVIDLSAVPIDPDGPGPDPPTGYLLDWTERLTGDYDMNGEVNLTDITPIVLRWNESPLYDQPFLHMGFASYPMGDPEFGGDVAPGDPPIIGSGAFNWRLARVDGDGNGEINLAEISTIVMHFGEIYSGYRVYRRGPGETVFTVLTDGTNPIFVSRSEANGGLGIDPDWTVRFEYQDMSIAEGSYEYRVVPYNAGLDAEGPPSLPGFDELGAVTAAITADITQGSPPVIVQFDASASTFISGPITMYSWDLDGDGFLEEFTGETPLISREYSIRGAWLASVEVRNEAGDSDVASIVISVTDPPIAQLTVAQEWLEVPLQVTFQASGSYDLDGEISGYEWDMDNDGEFELDTGPLSSRTLEYTEPGEITIGVRVRDNLGATNSTTLTVELLDDFVEQEDNDSFETSMELGGLSIGNAISGITGGIGFDKYDGDNEDWFSFNLSEGGIVTGELEFVHSEANLSLSLFGPDSDSLVAQATSMTDNESLSTPVLVAGTYYLLVSRAEGPGGGSAVYNLSVSISQLIYDEVENNDTPGQAQDLGNIDLGLLPQFIGNLGSGGYDGDDEDWFMFEIGADGSFEISLRFFHEAADLELQLYNEDGTTLIGSSSSVNDIEKLSMDLVAGSYVIRCFKFEGGNANYILSILNG